jgi:hypothetical protein
MNILETALRRIPVRKTEKVISSATSIIGGSLYYRQRKPKTWLGVTIAMIIILPLSLFGFTLIASLILEIASALFGIASLKTGLLIPSVWLACCFYNGIKCIYAAKGDLYTTADGKKTDRRYKVGQRVEGSHLVKSGEQYGLDDREKLLNRVEGWVILTTSITVYVLFVLFYSKETLALITS